MHVAHLAVRAEHAWERGRTTSSLESTSQTPSDAMTTYSSCAAIKCCRTSGSALTVLLMALLPNARVTASTPHTRATSSCTIVPPRSCTRGPHSTRCRVAMRDCQRPAARLQPPAPPAASSPCCTAPHALRRSGMHAAAALEDGGGRPLQRWRMEYACCCSAGGWSMHAAAALEDGACMLLQRWRMEHACCCIAGGWSMHAAAALEAHADPVSLVGVGGLVVFGEGKGAVARDEHRP
jgi:hypothetical protein